MKRLLINLPDDVHASLREYAFTHNQSMSTTVLAALTTMAFFAEKAKDAPVTPKIKEMAKEVTKELHEMFPKDQVDAIAMNIGKFDKRCKHGFIPKLCKHQECRK